MNLQTYLVKTRTKKSALASAIGVSPNLVYQWIKGIRPVAASHCKAIQATTNGMVQLDELRPLDWQKHWPEHIPAKRKRSPQPVL